VHTLLNSGFGAHRNAQQLDAIAKVACGAKNMPGAIATLAMAEGGTLLHAPDIYMDKIAVGPGYAKGVVVDDGNEEDERASALAPHKPTAVRDGRTKDRLVRINNLRR